MTSDPDFYKREYRQFVPIENLVTGQIGRISEYGSKKMWEYWIESIERLIDLLPPDVEDRVLEYKKNNNVVFNLSDKGRERYRLLFRFIKQELTNDNIVWKRSSGFSVGHD